MSDGPEDTLTDVREMYGESYQRDSAEARRLAIWRGFAQVFVDRFAPKTFLDVGCGAGGLVLAMQELGVESLGIEGSQEVLGLIPGIVINIADLRKPIRLVKRDLVTCFDVAEHIGAAETLCQTLADCTGEWLLFGAAEPEQGGLGHIDLRPHQEWHDMLHRVGFQLEYDLGEMVKAHLKNVPDENYMWWCTRNMFAYWRKP